MKTLNENLNRLICLLILVTSVSLTTDKSAAAICVVNVPAGFSTIANNLNASGGNTLNLLFNSTTAPGMPNLTRIYIYDCSGGGYTLFTWLAGTGNWVPAGGTLNPGIGAYLSVPGGAGFTVTFSGSLPPPSVPVPMLPGQCCLLSAQIFPNPNASFQDVTGFAPTACNVLARPNLAGGWTPSSPITAPFYDVFTYISGAWSPSTPTVICGESVMICNYNNNCISYSYNKDCVMSNSLAGDHFTNGVPLVKADLFGNVYVGATTVPANGDWKVLLLKYDCYCSLVPGWPQTFDVPSSLDELMGMDVDRAGNLYITCASSLSVRKARTRKYDPAGNLIWDVLFPAAVGGVTVDSFRPIGIRLNPAGNLRVAGTVTPAGGAPSRIAAVGYLAADGTLAGSGIAPLTAGSSGDQAAAMTLGANGTFVTGTFPQGGGLGTGCMTVRFNNALVFTMTRSIPGTLTENLTGIAIAFDPLHNWIRAVANDNVSGLNRWKILSYINNFALTPVGLWSVSGPGQLNYGSGIFAKAIAVDAMGNFTATGNQISPQSWITVNWFWNVPTSPNWVSTSPAIGVVPSAVKMDRFGNSFVTGGASGFGPSDFLTARYNSSAGGLDWSPNATFDYFIGASFNDTATDLDLAATDDVYVTGKSIDPSGSGPNDTIHTIRYSQGPVANDNCTGAQTLAGCNPGTVAFNNRFATDSAPVSSCPAENHDVWYTWTAPCNGTVELDTCGSCFDTVLNVYDAGVGGTCSSLGASIACNDNAGINDGRCPGGPQSYVTFSAVANHTYFFEVGGATPADFGDGRLTLIGPNPAPGSCPPLTGPYTAFRVFRLTGQANGLNWPWSITIPCCANVQALGGPVAAGGTTLQLATAFRNSLNGACPGTIQASLIAPLGSPNDPKRIRVRVRRCPGLPCNNGAFVLRVGPSGTPFSQLCIVPDASGVTISSLPASGICQFNPSIEEEYVPFEDCNGNGEPDDFDIAQGTSQDVNTNNIPDECESGCTNSGGQTYTMELDAGRNYLANQLNRPGGNTIGNVLPGVTGTASVYKWTGAGYVVNSYDPDLGDWNDPAMTLNPGEGFILEVAAATTVTFAGCPNPFYSLPAVTNGCALVANTTNAPARYEDLFGQPPSNCTTLTRYEGTNSLTYTYFSGYGWSPAEPVLGIGEPAFVCAGTSCLPVLSVQPSGINVVLSWSDDNFHLQAASALSPSTVWTNVEGSSPVTLPLGPDNLFFRLVTP